MEYNILILGSGGREYALATEISRNSLCKNLWVAPGNCAMPMISNKIETVSAKETDFESIKSLVIKEQIKIVIVGPEAPLVSGIKDFFDQDTDLKDVIVVGPSKAASALEGSKSFAKEFMERNSIPTASYEVFSANEFELAQKFLWRQKPPFVIKADGLAGGKGVTICDNHEDANATLFHYLKEGKFGDAGKKIVIEEFMKGTEISVFVLTDGTEYLLLPTAQDYKRLNEYDNGPNTGGMGAISPGKAEDPAFMEKVELRIIKPTLEGMRNEGKPYTGFLYIGLMRIGDDPFVVEYNCRLGDPETQAILPRWTCNVVEAFVALKNGSLSEIKKQATISTRATACVVLTALGYGTDSKLIIDDQIKWFGPASPTFTDLIFAGIKKGEGDKLLTSSGRVVGVLGKGVSSVAAANDAYSKIMNGYVSFPGMHYRRDIG